MTVEIDEKQVPVNTADGINFKKVKLQLADDSQVKISKPQPDDKYTLDCQYCNNSMVLQHNIHTNALLFQFYKCKCAYNDNHIIVRDKRTNESIVHRSKGIQHTDAARSRRHLLDAISRASKQYWVISRLIGDAIVDARLDLIVGEHMIDEYKIKLDDAKDDIDRLENRQSTTETGFSFRNFAAITDITAKKHWERYMVATEEHSEFGVWCYRLVSDTYASMIRSTISYTTYVYIHQVSDGDLGDYFSLVDMIACMSAIIDDLCDRATDHYYKVPYNAVASEEAKLTDTMYRDGSMTYARCRQTLKNIVDMCLVGRGVNYDSIASLLATLSSIADMRTLTPNEMEDNLRFLVISAVGTMTHRLECCDYYMATYQPPRVRYITDRQLREIELADRASTALDTMHN